MPCMLVRHKVEDHEKRRPVSDDHQATRRESDAKGGFLLRNADDPNEIVVLIEWEGLEDARRFGQSQDLRERM